MSYPIAVFHGIGDSCYMPGMSRITKYFGDQVGVYSSCIETGGGPIDIFTSFHSQAEKACNQIRQDNNFSGDFSVIGISQGALLARYIIEKCEMPGKVKRYISIGGPQMGVARFPHCESGIICNVVNYVVDKFIYTSIVQNLIGPAGYFKDNRNIDTFLQYSTFLADLNNEKEYKSETYKERMLELENMVLIKFSDDTMIIPKETAWFQFFDEQDKVQDITESKLYQEDYIGVRELHEQKKINFFELPGNHLSFDYSDIDEIMIPYLK